MISTQEREAAIAVLLDNARWCEQRMAPLSAAGLRHRAAKIRAGGNIEVDLLRAARRRMGLHAPAYVNPDARPQP